MTTHMTILKTLTVCIALAIVSIVATNVQADEPAAPGIVVGDQYTAPVQPDVFYNLYPNTMAGVNSAQAYPTPYPTPPIVGHVYYTYQPWMPHEYLYEHNRTYYNYYAGPEAFYSNPAQCRAGGYGLNKTTVVWQASGFSFNPVPLKVFPVDNLRRFRGSGQGCSTCR